MKQFFLFILVFYPSWALAAPRMQLPDRTHNFGELYRGQIVKHEFEFKNTGSFPLAIVGVHAPCGCTVVMASKERNYLPGETGRVEVSFDASHFSGNVSKSVSIVTNENRDATKVLTLRAHVREQIVASPPIVDFGELSTSGSPMRVVALSTKKDEDVEVHNLEFNSDVLDVEMTYEEKQQVWKIRIRLKPNLASGFLKETIYVNTSSRYLPRLPVPVRASVVGDIAGIPDYIEFGAIDTFSEAIRSVQFHSQTKQSIIGLRSELFINGISLERELQKPSVTLLNAEGKLDSQSVSLKLSNPYALTGSLSGVIFLQTSDPDAPEVPVRVFAYFNK